MSESELPENASLEYLKKVAKEHLRATRKSNPDAKLCEAQLDIARQYGFSNWRALKAEFDRRRSPVVEKFFAACRAGDAATLRALLEKEPELVQQRHANGTTGLHLAIRHPECVRLLLEYGADPNAPD